MFSLFLIIIILVLIVHRQVDGGKLWQKLLAYLLINTLFLCFFHFSEID